jgi:hypothetical protein
MTAEEQELVLGCGEFCHVATEEKAAFIDESGLNPEFDESIVLRGPKRPPAVYLCPAARLEETLDFIGDRVSEQEKLIVFHLPAEALSGRDCGPDYGFLVYFTKDLENATVELSLAHGSIACYELIPRGEFTEIYEVANPRYKPLGG